jgi:hypothetical protein
VQAILFGPGVKVVIKTKGIRDTKSILSIQLTISLELLCILMHIINYVNRECLLYF